MHNSVHTHYTALLLTTTPPEGASRDCSTTRRSCLWFYTTRGRGIRLLKHHTVLFPILTRPQGTDHKDRLLILQKRFGTKWLAQLNLKFISDSHKLDYLHSADTNRSDTVTYGITIRHSSSWRDVSPMPGGVRLWQILSTQALNIPSIEQFLSLLDII